MFWVIDNLLMGKRSKLKGHDKESRGLNGKDRKQRVHYYRSVPGKSSDGSESEVLVSCDDDDTKASNGSLLVRDPEEERLSVKRIKENYL